MTVAEITMPKEQVRAALREYREALRRRPNAEDALAAKTYGALARGHRVIDLIQAMQLAGLDDRGRPKLAIARADAVEVWCRVTSDGSARFSAQRWPRAGAGLFLPPGTLPRAAAAVSVECRALLPSIPPRFRPDGELERYHLLWEAAWLDVPTDPLLLRHLGQHLYVVLAQWDLTPVEQAILRRRPVAR